VVCTAVGGMSIFQILISLCVVKEQVVWMHAVIGFNMPSGNVATSYWNRDNSQANLNRNDSSNVDENYGASSAVRDYCKPKLSITITAIFSSHRAVFRHHLR
jgi:type II secretory pathway component PulC